MNRIPVSILCLTFLFSIMGCSEESDPNIRIRNERADKANVQIQTTGGNTININDVTAGQTTSYQYVAEGNVTVTAVIQNESVSPTATFFAAKDEHYTIVILAGDTPTLRVDRGN